MKGELSLGDQALDVLRQLVSNPHISLGDLVYQVREREGAGWDGPSVSQWAETVKNMTDLLAREDAERAKREERMREAAPELLALLKELVDIEGPLPGDIQWANKVRATIAKIEGKS